MADKILREYVISEPFADIAALEAFDTTPVSDGVIVNVQSSGIFKFVKTSTETPDGVNIIQPTVGGGRWFRMTGANASEPFVTVGPTLGQYAEINQAFAAGERNLYVIEDTTETASYTFTSQFRARVIVSPEVTVSYGNFSPYVLGGGSSGSSLYVFGGTHELQRTNKSWSDSSATFNNYIMFENMIIDDSASTTSTVYPFVTNSTITSNIDLLFRRVEIDLSNTAVAGFSGHSPYVNECIMRGGGTSCANIFNSTSASIRNSIFEGTVSSSSDILTLSFFSKIENTTFESLGSINLSLDNTYLEDVRESSSQLNITSDKLLNIINSRMRTAVTSLLSASEIYFCNAELSSIDDTLLNVSSGKSQRITNCRFSDNVNVGTATYGAYFISQTVFKGDFTASLTHNSASLNMVSCTVGSIGGSEVFTLSVGMNDAVIIGCRSATGLTDNATNTQQFANFTL